MHNFAVYRILMPQPCQRHGHSNRRPGPSSQTAKECQPCARWTTVWEHTRGAKGLRQREQGGVQKGTDYRARDGQSSGTKRVDGGDGRVCPCTV